jgi:hypothetical protein
VPEAAHAAGHAIPVSELILSAARSWPAERIGVGELIAAFGPRGHGLLIVVCALPNLLPFYLPGLSTLAGVPMLILCAQLACGLPTPRLPGFITRRTIARRHLILVTERAMPALRRVERLVRARSSFLTTPGGERLVGAFGVWLSAVVILPTPFTNGPPALACLVMAMGVLEEDSLTILAGAALGVLATIFAVSVLGSLGWALAGGPGAILGLP